MKKRCRVCGEWYNYEDGFPKDSETCYFCLEEKQSKKNRKEEK